MTKVTFFESIPARHHGVSPYKLTCCLLHHTTPVSQIRAMELLEELSQMKPIYADELLPRQAAIEMAVQDIVRLSIQSRVLVDRCLRLKAVPHPQVVTGF